MDTQSAFIDWSLQVWKHSMMRGQQQITFGMAFHGR
jgi:hypothetical protein